MEQKNNIGFRLSEYACWLTSITGIIYCIITAIGIAGIKEASQPVEQPYLWLMEVMILLIAPLMVVSMIGIYYYADPSAKTQKELAKTLFSCLNRISQLSFSMLTMSGELSIVMTVRKSFGSY